MKIALFLGAGASVPYDMPTTEQLRDKMMHKGLNFPRKDLLDSSRFPDIEHVLSVLDQLLSFMKSPAGELYEKFKNGTPDNERYDKGSYLLAIERLNSYVKDSHASKEVIETLITQNYRWNSTNNDAAKKILQPLFDLAKSKEKHVTIFTTNFDTVIEEYCGSPGTNIECVDGFKFHEARRTVVWDGTFTPQHDAFETKVFLHKLHGSMNWLADASGDRRPLLQKPDTSASDDRSRDMYIRPSLDTKTEGTQREPYATILHRFAQILPSFDVCIVIGYSFRDSHITENLINFVKDGKILVVLSPTASDDLESNALNKGPAPGEKIKWKKDTLQNLTIEFNGKRGVVYSINTRLGVDTMNNILDKIKSIISDDSSDIEDYSDYESGWM